MRRDAMCGRVVQGRPHWSSIRGVSTEGPWARLHNCLPVCAHTGALVLLAQRQWQADAPLGWVHWPLVRIVGSGPCLQPLLQTGLEVQITVLFHQCLMPPLVPVLPHRVLHFEAEVLRLFLKFDLFLPLRLGVLPGPVDSKHLMLTDTPFHLAKILLLPPQLAHLQHMLPGTQVLALAIQPGVMGVLLPVQAHLLHLQAAEAFFLSELDPALLPLLLASLQLQLKTIVRLLALGLQLLPPLVQDVRRPLQHRVQLGIIPLLPTVGALLHGGLTRLLAPLQFLLFTLLLG
mmetsp:Transcript_4078/g.9909  ORF Transcript_4078/g.9909 Transcript_4078/m.9909 type:complete len:289 (-) Transcript_4078:977-1843(-)